MTVIPDSEIFEAARQAHFAVALHKPEDFEGMRRAGRLAAEVLDMLVPEVKPGVTTAQLDKLAYDYVVSHGATPACLGYRGYRHTVCTSINHVVCHGIPENKGLRDRQYRCHGDPGWLAWRYQPHVCGRADQAESGAVDRHHL